MIEAAQYFKIDAEQGLAAAQSKYGLCLWTGEGFPRNISEVALSFRAAADQGDAQAQVNYGASLMNGDGVPRSMMRFDTSTSL